MGKIIRNCLLLALVSLFIFSSGAFAEPVSMQMAEDVARTHLRTNNERERLASLTTRKVFEKRSISIPDIIKLQDDQTGATLAYVQSLTPKGFIVVSPNTDITPVIAYSFEGNFPLEEFQDNVLLHMVTWDLENHLKTIPVVSEVLLTAYSDSLEQPASTPDPSIIIFENNWIVTEAVEISNKRVFVYGDLIIKEGGALSIKNTTLEMGTYGDDPTRIDVLTGGSFLVIDSMITSSSPDIGYEFIYHPDSTGMIERSTIEYIAPNDLSFGSGEVREHANLGGLTILANGFILRDSVIRNAADQARGILIAEVKDVIIEGNEITGHPRDGIRLAECQNITIRDNLVFRNGTYGVKFMNCSDSIIDNNVISENSFSMRFPWGAALFLEFGTTNVSLYGNSIENNGRHGVVMPQSSQNSIFENIISGNGGYAIWVYGGSTGNQIYNNTLFDNRLEGIYLEEGTENNNVYDNNVQYSTFDGVIDDYDNSFLDDYRLSFNDNVNATFNIEEGLSFDGSNVLQIEYSYTSPGCILSVFGKIGQNWSEYTRVEIWVLPDQDVRVELEFGEHDGDVWFYNWHNWPLTINEWNRVSAPLEMFIMREGRSTGDGIMNLDGIGVYRLSVCPVGFPVEKQYTILFDNVLLPKQAVYVDPTGSCGGNTPCYTTIQAATDAARSVSVIKVMAGTYAENLDLNSSINYELQGGWNSAYSSRTSTSSVSSMTFGSSSGIVTVGNIVVQ